MKVKVLERFFDKYTGEEHKKDGVIDVTPSRFAEINSEDKLVEAIKETKKDEKK